MSTRCSCLAITTQRICKHKFTCILSGKKYCTHHAKIVFSKEATYIQKIWRAHVIRNKMKNIFIRLDRDMQCKIIWYMREQHFIEKHHHTPIRNILNKKVRELFNVKETESYANGTLYFSTSVPNPNVCYLQQYYVEVTNLYNLYSKYNFITDDDYCHMLYSIQQNLIKTCAGIVIDNNMRNTEGNIVDANESALTYANLHDSITRWANLYCKPHGYIVPNFGYVSFPTPAH